MSLICVYFTYTNNGVILIYCLVTSAVIDRDILGGNKTLLSLVRYNFYYQKKKRLQKAQPGQTFLCNSTYVIS